MFLKARSITKIDINFKNMSYQFTCCSLAPACPGTPWAAPSTTQLSGPCLESKCWQLLPSKISLHQGTLSVIAYSEFPFTAWHSRQGCYRYMPPQGPSPEPPEIKFCKHCQLKIFGANTKLTWNINRPSPVLSCCRPGSSTSPAWWPAGAGKVIVRSETNIWLSQVSFALLSMPHCIQNLQFLS